MSVKTILLLGNELLRKKSQSVDFENDPVEDCIQDLRDTLRHFQKEKKIGRAIAAPQIGYHKRIVYMEKDDKRIIMINPQITKKSQETFEVWDSCFCADAAFFGNTRRYKRITVEYTDERQNRITTQFEDDLSELFQHEIDHLEGVLFTDRIIENQIMMRSEWEKLQRGDAHGREKSR
jgi:peptide deformylase